MPRGRTTVQHRHRVGRYELRRVSELVFVRGRPHAVLDWVDLGGDRTPLYLPLEAEKLRQAQSPKNRFTYEGTTVDPRFEDLLDDAVEPEEREGGGDERKRRGDGGK